MSSRGFDEKKRQNCGKFRFPLLLVFVDLERVSLAAAGVRITEIAAHSSCLGAAKAVGPILRR